MQWYYAVDGEQRGPFNDVDFAKLVQDGTVGSSTLVWNQTMTDWQSCRSLRAVINQRAQEGADQSAENDYGYVSCMGCGGRFPKEMVTQHSNSYICDSCKQDLFERSEEDGFFARGGGGAGLTSNSDLTARARAELQGKWGIAVVFTLLYYVIIQAFQGVAQLPLASVETLHSELARDVLPLLTLIVVHLIAGVFQLGVSRFYLDLVRNDLQGIERLFYGFKFFWKAAGTYLLMMLKIALWTMLFIIPGIIAGLAYAMTFYVLADNPEIDAYEALERSKRMMRGSKAKLFCLYCHFIGWSLLAILSCGIGLLWVHPYMMTSIAEFYEDVRGAE